MCLKCLCCHYRRNQAVQKIMWVTSLSVLRSFGKEKIFFDGFLNCGRSEGSKEFMEQTIT